MCVSKFLMYSCVSLLSVFTITNAGCTSGGNSVRFPSTTLTTVSSCDSNYDDPNNMNQGLFSLSKSGSSRVSNNFILSEFKSLDGDDKLRLNPKLV